MTDFLPQIPISVKLRFLFLSTVWICNIPILILSRHSTAMNNRGSEALFQASSSCKLRLVRMLVEGGTSVNVRNERQETPLMLCCQSKTDIDEKSRVLSYLLSQQAKVNLQDVDGRTALIYACISNSGKGIIQALMDAKSNPWMEDISKNTVFDYVMNAGDLETTRLLINACRENMEIRGSFQMENLEECLANMQEIRKFSWPLMGPRSRRNHMNLYAAEKEDSSISSGNLLGADLGGDGENPQPERRRKRSVCHFDPLDIQEILNCSEQADTNKSNTEREQEGKAELEEKRKTSVRSLSEEERFNVQISDTETLPRDPSSGLEKLLKLHDSFGSSDSNEYPCPTSDSHSNSLTTASFSCANLHSRKEENLMQETGFPSLEKIEDITSESVPKMPEGDYKSENARSFAGDETHKSAHSNEKNRTENPDEQEKLFIARNFSMSVMHNENCSSFAEASIQSLRHVNMDSAVDRAFLENAENRSNRIVSPVTSQQSSPVLSPIASPRVTRRQTTALTFKQTTAGPRTSPVPPIFDNNQQEAGAPIVRRYTLSAVDMGKLQNTAGIMTLLTPPTHSSTAEIDTRRVGLEGCFAPPGLRKSKSDLTDWMSISRNLQGKEFVEIGPSPGPSIQSFQQHVGNNKEGSDTAELQLPSIKKGSRSMIITTTEGKPQNAEHRMELALPWPNNADKQRLCFSGQELSLDDQRRSPSPGRTSLPSSPKDLTVASTTGTCDAVATAKAADLSPPRGSENSSGDVLPDLLLNSPTRAHYTEENNSKLGESVKVNSTNFNLRNIKDALASNSNVSEDRNAASPPNQQRVSPRLRSATLLPPLTISNRRSPTHDLEDGYFSGSPSPADVESPRRKSSSEYLRYSFRPISPRSPIRSPKFNTGKSSQPR